MDELFESLNLMLNDKGQEKFASGEMKEKLCDPQIPFRVIDRLSFKLLMTGTSFPFSCSLQSGTKRVPHRPRWDFEEVLHDAFNSAERKNIFDGIHEDISKWLLRDTWLNYTKSVWDFIIDVRNLIKQFGDFLRFIKLLACAAILDLIRLPKQVDAVSRYIKDNFLDATEDDFTLLKTNVDRAYEVYLSQDYDWISQTDYLRSIHDSLYNTAKWCAFLPSAMHVYSVEQTSNKNIAGGGFADVYQGQMTDGQVVALKIPRNFGTPEQVRKIHAEVCKEALLWDLSCHENILPLLNVIAMDSATDGLGRIVLITPWMSNGSLNKYLASNPGVDKMRIAKGIHEGLMFLHDERVPSVVHGDLRCNNILVDDKGNPRIADFGLSRVEATQATLTGTSAARGSLRWQAPELLLPDTYGGNGKHTRETDIYAFGMTLLEVINGGKAEQMIAADVYLVWWE